MAKPTREDADLFIKIQSIASKNVESWQWLLGLEQMDYEAFIKKNPIKSKGFAHFLRIAAHFELIGTLVIYEAINEDLVLDFYGTNWSKLGPIFEGLRKAMESPRLFENYEVFAEKREWLETHPPKIQQ